MTVLAAPDQLERSLLVGHRFVQLAELLIDLRAAGIGDRMVGGEPDRFIVFGKRARMVTVQEISGRALDDLVCGFAVARTRS